MDGSQPVKLFRHGGNQAVDIPPEFELPGEDAIMRREGDRLVIEPSSPKGSIRNLLAVLAKMEALDEKMEPFEDFPPEPVNL